MKKIAVVVLALVAFTNGGLLNAIGDLAGGIVHGTMSVEKLQGVLAQGNDDGKVKSVDSVKQQIVAGIKYIVEYTTEDDKKCTAIWVEQAWKNPSIQSVSIKCD